MRDIDQITEKGSVCAANTHRQNSRRRRLVTNLSLKKTNYVGRTEIVCSSKEGSNLKSSESVIGSWTRIWCNSHKNKPCHKFLLEAKER